MFQVFSSNRQWQRKTRKAINILDIKMKSYNSIFETSLQKSGNNSKQLVFPILSVLH